MSRWTMGLRRASRRAALQAAGGTVLASTVLAGGLQPAPARAQAAPSVVGVWSVAFRPSGLPPDAPPVNPTPILFGRDGTVVVGFRPSAVAASGARSYFGTLLGFWTGTGERRVSLAYTGGRWDEQGALQGRGEVHAVVEVSEAGDTFSGSSVDGAVGWEGQRLLSPP